MTINQKTLIKFIAQAPPDIIHEVLALSNLPFDTQEPTYTLAERLIKTLWWQTHTPLGYQFSTHTLESILFVYSSKLNLTFYSQDGWQQLKELTDHLVPPQSDIPITHLSEDLKRRLQQSAWKTATGLGGTATAIGTRWAATRLLMATAGSTWKWLKFMPKIGPVLVGVRTTAGWVANLSGPVAIALAVYTANQALGPRWDEGLPILLGIGLIQRHQGQLATTG